MIGFQFEIKNFARWKYIYEHEIKHIFFYENTYNAGIHHV